MPYFKKGHYAALAGSSVLFVAALLAPLVKTPILGANNPALMEARRQNEELQPFSNSRVADDDTKLDAFRRQCWTDTNYKVWHDTTIPKDWISTDLGTTKLQHVIIHTFAFQKAQATSDDWPGISHVLESLDTQPYVSVQSVDLAVFDSLSGSRNFRQCLITASFYFAGDTASITPKQ